jgi:hypothetical protein
MKYCSPVECDEEDKSVDILIRGGRILKIPFSAKVVIPKVEIEERVFDFEKLTVHGKAGEL